MCGIFGVLGLAGLDFFEAVKVVTLRLRLSRHNLGSSPAGTSRLRDFHFIDSAQQDSAAPAAPDFGDLALRSG